MSTSLVNTHICIYIYTHALIPVYCEAAASMWQFKKSKDRKYNTRVRLDSKRLSVKQEVTAC